MTIRVPLQNNAQSAAVGPCEYLLPEGTVAALTGTSETALAKAFVVWGQLSVVTVALQPVITRASVIRVGERSGRMRRHVR